jgi:hypothetical protein
MPLYYFQCEACQKERRRLMQPADADKGFNCECGGQMKRNAQPATANIVETIDNGWMPRKVTRIANAEEVFKERSKQRP